MVPAVDWLIAGAAADSGDEVQRMGDRSTWMDQADLRPA